jgi:hypothetical protein
MARLGTYVHLVDEDGQAYVFGPSDDVPGWAQLRITNPKAWAVAPEPAPELVKAPAKKTAAPRAGRKGGAADDPVLSG